MDDSTDTDWALRFFTLAIIEVGWYNWGLVVFYCLLATVFIYGLLRPRGTVEWRSFGIAWAWVIALYAEMYGIPLTLYVLAAVVGPHLAPGDDFQLGHVWAPLFHLESPYWNLALTLIGNLAVLAGAALALIGWRHLWSQRNTLATRGIYRYLRHPQYAGFFLVILGSLINWPTLPTLIMTPLLMATYCRLARLEEQHCSQKFGAQYAAYAACTGRFLPPCFRGHDKAWNA